MSAREIFENQYKSYCAFVNDSDVYNWAACEIFDLTTYDGTLDELFVQTIVAVCKVIIAKQNFEFIKTEELYVAYIVVCQMLEHRGWINWGTSIRGAWFEEDKNAKPIFKSYDETADVPFTIENLITLIEFIEEKGEKNNGKANTNCD